ncbi:MAG: hypothetical protein ACE5DI_04980 [Candidatus Micrarchaeia archaeon]
MINDVKLALDRAGAKMRFFSRKAELSTPALQVLAEYEEAYGVKKDSNPVREAVMLVLFKNSVESEVAPALVPSIDSQVLLGKHSSKSLWAANSFVPLGGVIRYEDFEGCETLQEVFSKTLSRELREDVGIDGSYISHSYAGSFYDSKLDFTVHAFSGFVVCDPDKDCSEQHFAQVSFVPKSKEHQCFSWVPVEQALSSKSVHKTSKHIIRTVLKRNAF